MIFLFRNECNENYIIINYTRKKHNLYVILCYLLLIIADNMNDLIKKKKCLFVVKIIHLL